MKRSSPESRHELPYLPIKQACSSANEPIVIDLSDEDDNDKVMTVLPNDRTVVTRTAIIIDDDDDIPTASSNQTNSYTQEQATPIQPVPGVNHIDTTTPVCMMFGNKPEVNNFSFLETLAKSGPPSPKVELQPIKISSESSNPTGEIFSTTTRDNGVNIVSAPESSTLLDKQRKQQLGNDTNCFIVNVISKNITTKSRQEQLDNYMFKDIIPVAQFSRIRQPPNLTIQFPCRFFIAVMTPQQAYDALIHSAWSSTRENNEMIEQCIRYRTSKQIYLLIALKDSFSFSGLLRLVSSYETVPRNQCFASDMANGKFGVQTLLIRELPYLKYEGNDKVWCIDTALGRKLNYEMPRDCFEIDSRSGLNLVKRWVNVENPEEKLVTLIKNMNAQKNERKQKKERKENKRDIMPEVSTHKMPNKKTIGTFPYIPPSEPVRTSPSQASASAHSPTPIITWHLVVDTSFLYNIDVLYLETVLTAKKGRYRLHIPMATMEELDLHIESNAKLRPTAIAVTGCLGRLLDSKLAEFQLDESPEKGTKHPRKADIRIMDCAKALNDKYPGRVVCASDDRLMNCEIASHLLSVTSMRFKSNDGDLDLAVI